MKTMATTMRAMVTTASKTARTTSNAPGDDVAAAAGGGRGDDSEDAKVEAAEINRTTKLPGKAEL